MDATIWFGLPQVGSGTTEDSDHRLARNGGSARVSQLFVPTCCAY